MQTEIEYQGVPITVVGDPLDEDATLTLLIGGVDVTGLILDAYYPESYAYGAGLGEHLFSRIVDLAYDEAKQENALYQDCARIENYLARKAA